MPNVRMIPQLRHDGANCLTVDVGDVRYQATAGVPVDVPFEHYARLAGCGWIPVARANVMGSAEPGLVGPTSGRPSATLGSGIPLAAGSQFLDSTLNTLIIWDAVGGVWRDPATGAAV